jgi:Flp pilus assembly protein CpaB
MTYRIRNIVLALGLALIAALLVTFYVNNYRKNVQQGEEAVKVYVAARDIPTGTPGAEIVEGSMLKTQEVAKRSVAPGAIASPSQIEKLVAADPIYAGEQVSTRRFTTVEEKGIRSQISGTTRAFQVPGDQHQLLAGTLKAGDRVDVVASIKYKVDAVSENGVGAGATEDRVASRVVLRDLLVLKAAPQQNATEKIANPTSSSISVLLAVTDSQAQKLFFVLRNGDWSLQLRPTDDPADSPESVETVESVLGDGLKRQQLEQLIFGFSEGSDQ